MENKSITTVEWIEKKFSESHTKYGMLTLSQVLDIIRQANAMEKEQIKDAYDKAFSEGLIFAKNIEHKLMTFQEYYNEKYK